MSSPSKRRGPSRGFIAILSLLIVVGLGLSLLLPQEKPEPPEVRAAREAADRERHARWLEEQRISRLREDACKPIGCPHAEADEVVQAASQCLAAKEKLRFKEVIIRQNWERTLSPPTEQMRVDFYAASQDVQIQCRRVGEVYWFYRVDVAHAKDHPIEREAFLWDHCDSRYGDRVCRSLRQLFR